MFILGSIIELVVWVNVWIIAGALMFTLLIYIVGIVIDPFIIALLVPPTIITLVPCLRGASAECSFLAQLCNNLLSITTPFL